MTVLSKNIQLIRGLMNVDQYEFGRIILPGENEISQDQKEIRKIRSKVSSYEKGIAQPPLVVLANIAKAAGVSIDQLTKKELTLSEINVKKSNKTNDSERKELSTSEMFELIRKEMTFIKATLKVYGLKLINIEAKIFNSPFDEVFSDHEKKIAQEVMRQEDQS